MGGLELKQMVQMPGCHFRLLVAQVLLLLATSSRCALHPRQAPGLEQQKQVAAACLARWGTSSGCQNTTTVGDRLAAVYLHWHASTSHRDKFLQCSIKALWKNIGATTPVNVFLFVPENRTQHWSKELEASIGSIAKEVCIMPIPDAQFTHMPGAAYALPGNANNHGNYLIMGQWRLLVPYHLITQLGYRYFLQIDDDLIVKQPLQRNIIKHMDKYDFQIASHQILVERPHIMAGLPELARFFLTSNRLKPGGTLLKHINPPDLAHLRTPTHNGTGYDLKYPFGNFQIMRTQLWASARVQDWITLCMSSGGMERHRWQEQGVMAFVWLLFTEPCQLWMMEPPEFLWVHKPRKSDLDAV